MILEPKHKNFTGPWQIKETVKKRFNIRRHMSIPKAFECNYFNPFQCGSFERAHRVASGPISPDNIGLFWPVPPVENTSHHSCGPIGEAPFGTLLIWACKLLRKLLTHTLPPPPRYSLLSHRAAAKIGCGTRIHTAFWAWRIHFTKKFIKGFR